MLFGVVGRLYNTRFDNFVQQLNRGEPELLGLLPLEVMQFVEAVYGSSSKQPSIAVWAFDEVNIVPDVPGQPTWFQQHMSEAVKAREAALYSLDCTMMPVFITAGTSGSAVSLLKTTSRKSPIQDIRLAMFSGLQEQQLMVMDVIRRLPWPADKQRPVSLPGQEGSLSSLGEEQQQQLLQCCPPVLTELLQWCGNLFRAVEFALAVCGGVTGDGKRFYISRLPRIMVNGVFYKTEDALQTVAGILARSSGWGKYCAGVMQNHQLMQKVYAYSITWKPVSRRTVLMPGTKVIRVQEEADWLVLLASRCSIQGTSGELVSNGSEGPLDPGEDGDVDPDAVENFAITLPPIMVLMLQQLEAEAAAAAPQGWAAIPLLRKLADWLRNRDITDVVTLALRLQLYREVFKEPTVSLRDLHPGFSKGPCDVTVLTPTGGYSLAPTLAGEMTPSKFEASVTAATTEANWLFVGPGDSGPADSWVVLLEADPNTGRATGGRVVIHIQSKLHSGEDRVSSMTLIHEVEKVPMLQQDNCKQAFMYVSGQLPGKGLQKLPEQDVNIHPSPWCSSENHNPKQQLQIQWLPKKRTATVLRDGKQMQVVLVLRDEEQLYRRATTVVKHAVQQLKKKQKLDQ